MASAFRAGAVTAFQAEALLRVPEIGSGPVQSQWESHAKRVTLRRLEDDVPAGRAAIEFRAPPDEPGNRTMLCAFHHQRGVHATRVRIAGWAPEGLIYELGTRRGGPPLVRFRSGDVIVRCRSPQAVRAAVR